MGRLTIPIRLREEVGMNIGEVYSFYKLEQGGRMFLCIDCGEVIDPIEEAKKQLREAGYTIEPAAN